MTPLQSAYSLTRALEQADRVGEKPVTPAVVMQTLAPDLHALEPPWARYGDSVKVVADLLNLRHAAVRTLLHGQLPPGRPEE